MKPRGGGVSVGAAIALAALLFLGVAVFSSSGNQLISSLRSFSFPNSQNLSASISQMSNLASIFKNITSFPPANVFLPSQTPGTLNATSNWAGYIVSSTSVNGIATFVNGTWIQPQVNCPSKGVSGVLIWVGLGGLSNSPVRQIGTISYCNDGRVVYLGWYESYPSDGGIKLLNNIKPIPGQQVYASVAYSASINGFTYSIGLAGQTPYFISESYSNIDPPRSAEWIVEPPFAPHGFLAMPNFGTVTFVKGAATVNGRSDSITGFNGGSDLLIRTEYSCSGVAKASPGPLASSSGFSVSWSAGGGC